MAKTQRIEQVCRRIGTGFGSSRFAERGRQRRVRIEQGDQVPAPGRGGVVERAASIAARLPGLRAEREQGTHGPRLRMWRLAGQGQRIAAVVIAQAWIGLCLGEQLHDVLRAGARRFHQRRAAVAIDQADVGVRAAQHAGDLFVAFGGGGHQCAATVRADRVHRCLVLEQQLHALDIVVGDTGGGDQGRLAIGRRRACAAFEQEADHRPVGGPAGDAERAGAGVIECVDRRAGVEQHRGDRRLLAERGAMQRRIAFAVGDRGIRAIGEQGHRRVGTAMPAVAGGGEQGGKAAAGAIDIGTLADQRAQQARIGQECGEHQHRALVAIVGLGRGVRVGAGVDQGQRAFDVAIARGQQQGMLTHARFDFLGFQYRRRDRGDRLRRALPGHAVRRMPRMAAIAEHGAQGAVGDHHAAERQQHQAIEEQRDDAQFRGQHAVQAGQRDRAEGEHQQAQRGGKEMREEALLGRQVPGEGDAAGHRGEDPRTVAAMFRIGVVPDEDQAERRPHPPQRRERHDQGGCQQEGGTERRRLGQPEHRPGHQHEQQYGVTGEHHHVGGAATQGGAGKARFRVEADRVAYRSHRQRIGQQ